MKGRGISFTALAALAACAPVADGSPPDGGTGVGYTLARSGFIVPGSGTDGLVAFGASEAETVAAASRALGAPISRTNNEDCGAGPLTFVNYAEIALHFRAGEFAGWSSSVESRLETPDGIGIGDSERDLSTFYATEIVEGSLDREFNAEGFYGLIEDGVITAMWAGVSCNFR